MKNLIDEFALAAMPVYLERFLCERRIDDLPHDAIAAASYQSAKAMMVERDSLHLIKVTEEKAAGLQRWQARTKWSGDVTDDGFRPWDGRAYSPDDVAPTDLVAVKLAGGDCYCMPHELRLAASYIWGYNNKSNHSIVGYKVIKSMPEVELRDYQGTESASKIKHERDSAIGCLRSIVTEWNRQKELFPEIKKDGWMDSLIDGAHGLLMNIEGES